MAEWEDVARGIYERTAPLLRIPPTPGPSGPTRARHRDMSRKIRVEEPSPVASVLRRAVAQVSKTSAIRCRRCGGDCRFGVFVAFVVTPPSNRAAEVEVIRIRCRECAFADESAPATSDDITAIVGELMARADFVPKDRDEG